MANQVTTLKMEQKFKKTPAGEIPADWDLRTLGELCLAAPEYGANVSAVEFRPEWPRYVRITDINDAGVLSSAGRKSIKDEDSKSYLLEKGDIIFARSGATVGKTYLYRKSDGPCAFAGYTIRFKPDPQRLLPEFLLQFTHSQLYYQWVKGMLRAGAQPNINGSEYSRLYLPIPPLDEQKKITEILSTVDDAIEKTSAVIEKSNQLKKGLMQTLLTRGIGHTKFKKSPAGEIPVDWEVVKLGDVAVQPEERFVPVPGDARPYIGLEHIGSGTGRLLSTGTSTTVSSLKSIFRAGDILFGKLRPNLKKVVMPSFDGVCSTDIMVIRPKDGLSRSFMFYRLQSATAFDFAVGTSGGTKMPRTSWPLFRNYAFPCPHLAEQKKIAEILSGLDAKIEQEEAALMETQKLKHGLMRALLTGRVRVTK